MLLLIILAFLTSFAELATIGAVIPFVASLMAPERLLTNSTIAPLLQSLSITEPSQLLVLVTLLFGALGLAASIIRVTQAYASVRFSYGLGTEISASIFRRALYSPYEVHIQRNSSELINAITSKTTALAKDVVLGIVDLSAGVITMTSVVVGLIFIDPVVTLSVFAGLASIYVLTFSYARNRLLDSSRIVSRNSTSVIKLLQESLGGIRDVLIGSNQEAYIEAYQKSDYLLRRAQGYTRFISVAPRYLIEGLGMCCIALVSYFLASKEGGIGSALPVLAALALGAQRLLPVMQQSYNAIANIRGHQASLFDAVELLEQPLPLDETWDELPPLSFSSFFELRDLSFRYAQHRTNILNNISISIRKGMKVGIIGRTGSGKSTLIDVIMGLLRPTDGAMLIDGTVIDHRTRKSWQRHVSHVPQSIFLVDGSIAENIALTAVGKTIDMARVRKSAQMANISSTIEQMPNGYASTVGERGVRLSGGQRQRIGIARALYKNADVIVLDEATSALDNETEEDVMKAIRNLDSNLTFFIVAHRLTTLQNCDLVVELENGTIGRVGPYDEIVGQKMKSI